MSSPDYSEIFDGERSLDANGTITIMSECGKVNIATLDPGYGHIMMSAASTFSLVCGSAFISIVNPAYMAAQAEEEAQGEALVAASMVPGGGSVGASTAESVSADATEDASEDAAGDELPMQVTIGAGPTGNITIVAGLPVVGPSILLTAVPDPEEEEAQPAVRLGIGQSFIEITEEYIKIQVGETVYLMTDEGIVEECGPVTRELDFEEGHSMTAGEAAWTLEYAGDAKEGPTELNEVEGGKLENDTMEMELTDAIAEENKSVKNTMP